MMKKALVLALAAVVCAAWFASSELPELGEGDTNAATVGVAGFPSGRAGVSAARPRIFATLPDRGDLMSYPTPSPARVDGAYTWHRAELSEEHAFRSLQTGSLRITSPSGKPLEFEYSRHVEHPSGDWTWIGRLRGGKEADEAVITFGERAAFGAIAEPGKPDLRLTTSAGVAWLVETDPRKIATINSEATRPKGPDYLIPPEQQASPAASQPTPIAAASAPTSSAAVAAAAATTVDVVVGYTAGFAAALGGQSQAVTRLNNMVQIANEAYRNSQVDAEIRMVHALQVNYPDNTSNADTLEKLTGYRSGSGQVPVDPAFTALRAARDQYGGDLVTLVRKFQTPENNGCGIAWMIGGGQTGIDAGDAPFGYSVVSDGTDVGADGKSYFCRQETFAHELGHNFGSQHDRVTATENGQVAYGVFPYSFGYKADSPSGNFYTVMAYGDSGQTAFRIFSNPRSTYCGVPCGISEQADNARSLAQTMPVVAAFRGTVVPIGPRRANSDYDGDGQSDIYWRNYQSGYNDIWFLNGAALRNAATVYREMDVQWRVIGSGDFNGDGRADVFWRNQSTGQNFLQFMNGSQVLDVSGFSNTLDPDWRVGAIADFDGDQIADVYWRNRATGITALWIMGGATYPRGVSTVHREVSENWAIVGAGDFNADGRADVFWRNTSTGQNLVHLMDGGRIIGGTAFTDTVSDLTWRIVALADFNGDGRTDVYWRNTSSGLNYLWTMNAAVVSNVYFVHREADQNWRVVMAGDFNADGYADILWRNFGTGQNIVHLMSGPSVLSGSAQVNRVPDLSWEVVGVLSY